MRSFLDPFDTRGLGDELGVRTTPGVRAVGALNRLENTLRGHCYDQVREIHGSGFAMRAAGGTWTSAFRVERRGAFRGGIRCAASRVGAGRRWTAQC
jgi:hypothetical protein